MPLRNMSSLRTGFIDNVFPFLIKPFKPILMFSISPVNFPLSGRGDSISTHGSSWGRRGVNGNIGGSKSGNAQKSDGVGHQKSYYTG